MKVKIIFLMIIGSLSTSAFATNGNECLIKVNAARTALLAFKDGKTEEKAVHQTAAEASDCLENLDAKGKTQKKIAAIAAWKIFRSIREEKLVPAIKAGNKAEADKLTLDNKTNLDTTKTMLSEIISD